MYKFAKIMDCLLKIATGILAVVLLLYSVYVLYDNFSISREAYTSPDLLQYKPSENGEDPQPGFEELMAINPDVVGWLTIYDTNIDYPVVQGRDNMEYINKNIHGEFSLSGSIYLAAENEAQFNDDYNMAYGHNFASPQMFLNGYNLFYGHNVSGGAMFGDIPRYLNRDYFYAHQKGLLQTPGGNYNLDIFACVVTDAYESVIYSLSNRQTPADPSLMRYIHEHARVYDEKKGKNITKLLAFSTCSEAETDGRIVVFANATPTDGSEMPGTQDDSNIKRTAVGHGQRPDAWALLNLICVVLTALTLFPVGNLRRKYGQFRYSRQLLNELEEIEREETDQQRDDACEQRKELGDDLKRFRRKLRFGFIVEALLSLLAVVVFLCTERLQAAVTVIDRWTPWMILIFALALLSDYICFRYRGLRPEEVELNAMTVQRDSRLEQIST